MAQSDDARSLGVVEQQVKWSEAILERAKGLNIEGAINKAGSRRQSDQLKGRLVETKAQLCRVAPDLRKLEQESARMDRIIDLVREGNLAEQREAIDALVERAVEKQGEIVRVVFRGWARGLLSEQSAWVDEVSTVNNVASRGIPRGAA